jgi:hypothetical protein
LNWSDMNKLTLSSSQTFYPNSLSIQITEDHP